MTSPDTVTANRFRYEMTLPKTGKVIFAGNLKAIKAHAKRILGKTLALGSIQNGNLSLVRGSEVVAVIHKISLKEWTSRWGAKEGTS